MCFEKITLKFSINETIYLKNYSWFQTHVPGVRYHLQICSELLKESVGAVDTAWQSEGREWELQPHSAVSTEMEYVNMFYSF